MTLEQKFPRVEVDSDSGLVYIYLSRNKVHHTENAAENVLIDLDDAGQAVGVEILGWPIRVPGEVS